MRSRASPPFLLVDGLGICLSLPVAPTLSSRICTTQLLAPRDSGCWPLIPSLAPFPHVHPCQNGASAFENWFSSSEGFHLHFWRDSRLSGQFDTSQNLRTIVAFAPSTSRPFLKIRSRSNFSAYTSDILDADCRRHVPVLARGRLMRTEIPFIA